MATRDEATERKRREVTEMIARTLRAVAEPEDMAVVYPSAAEGDAIVVRYHDAVFTVTVADARDR